MASKKSREREYIIKDFIDINFDIISLYDNSKYPKFIAKLIEKRYRKKLKNRVLTLRKSNTPLSFDNLCEFASIIHDMYIPNGSFKNIMYVNYYPNDDSYNMRIDMGDIKCNIVVYTKRNEFQLFIDTNNNTHTITLKELYTNNKNIKKYVSRINDECIKLICDYLDDYLSSFD